MQQRIRRSLALSAGCVTILAVCIQAYAACHVKGCPPYTTQPVALPQNQVIGVVATTAIPDGATTPMSNALSTLNGQAGPTQNGTGTTFVQYATYEDAAAALGTNGVVVSIGFDTTSTTPPPCDGNTQIVGCGGYTPSSAGSTTAESGTITIYLGSQTCGGACFNQNQSGYAAAIQGVIEHEFYHGLGIGNTSSPGQLMSPFTNENINGTLYSNNSGGTTSPQSCDKKETQRAAKQRATGAPCPS